jgi:Flp pilus assembly protein TadB
MTDNTNSEQSGISTSVYGILFSVILVLELVISYVLNIGTDSSYGTIIMILNYVILPAVFVYLGCQAFKQRNSGFISFGQCLKTGVLICLIAGVISAIVGVILNMIFPEYMVEIMSQAKKKMLEQNPDMTTEQLEMGLSMMEKFSKPWLTIPITIVMYSFVGLIHSLIIGAIVKKDRPTSF